MESSDEGKIKIGTVENLEDGIKYKYEPVKKNSIRRCSILKQSKSFEI